MDLFAGKKGLILGVFNHKSIAWQIAEVVMNQGGDCGFSYMPDKADDPRQKNRGRLMKLLEGQPRAKFVHPMDVTSDEQITSLMQKTAQEFGKIDFVLHSIAFAPPQDLQGETIATSREGFKLAMEISAYSLLAVCRAARDICNSDASILTLTYYGGERVVAGYNVMGICKAALDCTVRYMAYDLGPSGIRVNALSAGPVDTVSMRGVGDSSGMVLLYETISPLQRNITPSEVGRTGAFLLSDMSNGITGEILHVDAGYNIMGSPGRMLEKYRNQPVETVGAAS
jgi:enoyl-[acyl-carrier protein] reductase I